MCVYIYIYIHICPRRRERCCSAASASHPSRRSSGATAAEFGDLFNKYTCSDIIISSITS